LVVKSLVHCWAIVCTKVEPAPDTVPVAHATWAVVVAVVPPELDFLLLPHAPASTATHTTIPTSPLRNLI
jgi:hypothetical protein